MQAAIHYGELPPHCQRPAEHDLTRFLRDVDEAARANDRGFEPAHVDITCGVHFGESQERHVDSAAVIERELFRCFNDRRAVVRRSEFETFGGNAAYLPLLNRGYYLFRETLFARDLHDAVRHTESQVQHGARV